MRFLATIAAATASLFLMTGCEDEQESNLFKAQQCINKATQATVTNCRSFIAGDTSERSYVLQCSIAFVSQGIEESAIVDALENIDQDGQTTDPTITAVSALTMSDTTASTEAVTVCSQSGSKALTALANFANVATSMSSVLGVINNPNLTEADIQTAIDGFAGDATDLGNAVVASQDSLCNAEDGLLKGTESCTDINNAIANNPGNEAAIGQELLNLIDGTP
ncbi:MAG: hypothetical protein HRT44_09540 [Bdellovibrionales bacterium]|nr:hypothetical protein [Bdellovibrionales bacterium]NQZ19482.1 hypothetical protein [Bdellovibrionales bacterium]